MNFVTLIVIVARASCRSASSLRAAMERASANRDDCTSTYTYTVTIRYHPPSFTFTIERVSIMCVTDLLL
jgi:hypothetical protein